MQTEMFIIKEVSPPAITHETSGGTTYYGFALPKIGTGERMWKILRQTQVSDGAGGTITQYDVPNSDYDFNYVWDLRLTYTYSR